MSSARPRQSRGPAWPPAPPAPAWAWPPVLLAPAWSPPLISGPRDVWAVWAGSRSMEQSAAETVKQWRFGKTSFKLVERRIRKTNERFNCQLKTHWRPLPVSPYHVIFKYETCETMYSLYIKNNPMTWYLLYWDCLNPRSDCVRAEEAGWRREDRGGGDQRVAVGAQGCRSYRCTYVVSCWNMSEVNLAIYAWGVRTGTDEVSLVRPWLGGFWGQRRLTRGQSDGGDPVHNLDISDRIS